MANEIKERILAFYDALKADPNHRYRSWEHCFDYFSRHNLPDFNPDTAALHLAFYLASWGMLRGASALLWKDYKIHQPAISKLLDRKYDVLWGLDFDDAEHDQKTADLICELSGELRGRYKAEIKMVNGKSKDFEATDTLVTKILLGTIGCAPACDRYFIKGFRQHPGLHYSGFKPKFLTDVIQFCRKNGDELRETKQEIARQCVTPPYPLMKLVDMYFWKLGVDLSPEVDSDAFG